MLWWQKPEHPNGVLRPYRVYCFDMKTDDDPIIVSTKDNKTTKIIVKNLKPRTAYECLVYASTVAAEGQDPAECERPSDPSEPIWTLPKRK